MSCSKPNWELLLDCAERLTAAGTTPFGRQDLIGCVQREHPDRLDQSLNPTIQGMTRNARGGHQASCGTPFVRVDRGLYELEVTDAVPPPRAREIPAAPVPRPKASSSDTNVDWHWEGNVQNALAAFLEREGWSIIRLADTASRQQGVDLLAERGGEVLAVEVKGFPGGVYTRGDKRGQEKPTRPATQARHWYASALLSLLLLRNSKPKAKLGLALPSSFPTYTSLVKRTKSSLSALGITVYFVSEDGSVRVVE